MSNPEDPTTSVRPRIAHTVLRPLAKLALAAWVGVGALATVAVRPDHLLVEHVEFRGVARASEPALRHLVGVTNGTTMWGVDTTSAAKGAERHPWVKSATAHRAWPDTLVVDVEEHVPSALLVSDRLYYVDAEGNVFMEARGEDVDYPLITGIDGSLGDAHPDLPRVAIRDALGLVAELEARDLVDASDVSEIAFSPARGFTVVLRRSLAARLVFGLEHHDREIDRLERLVAEGVDLSKPLLVDLAPERIAIVRPLTPTPPGT